MDPGRIWHAKRRLDQLGVSEGALPPDTVSGSLARYCFGKQQPYAYIHRDLSWVDQTIFSLYGGIPGDPERMRETEHDGKGIAE